MKKILFIADARSIHSHKWIDYIAKKGNSKITWVSLNNSKYDLEKTINFIFIKSNFLIKSLKVFKIILFSRPHIIHLHYIGLHSLFLLFIRENSKLIINTWGSDLCFSERNFLRKYWLKNLLRKSHTVISDAYHHFEFLVSLLYHY